MSEEKETSVDKQEELKEKLKDMGVMQDETKQTETTRSTAPTEGKLSFLKSQWPVFMAIIAVMLFGWMYVFNDKTQTTTTTVADKGTSLPTTPYEAQGYPPAPPNFPYGDMPPPPSRPGYARSDNGTNEGDAGKSSTAMQPQEPWANPMHRGDDRFGPPPGWRPYGPPPSVSDYYGPPPGYYEQPYFGPPPGWDPYGPPPGFYEPYPGYFPGY